MFGPAHSPRSKLQITLDGKPLALPGEKPVSLASVRACLESAALQNRRILMELHVDGAPVNLSDPLDGITVFTKVSAISIHFSDLGEHLLWLAAAQTDRLRSRVEWLSLTVMINEWAAVQRLWWELLPDLKTPMITLNYLPELLEKKAGKNGLAALEPFIHSIQDLREILVNLDDALNRRDLFAFSEGLEKKLGSWLGRFSTFLENLYALHRP
jgi:hypothetical protein